ncbi:MAG: TetR/AcrR family transcriptional regulator [Actinomycetota bacterium]|nr:TetR/AcrR family transcriptional regulator [Actinomycetota bacterium]MDP2287092.1 TetR/AcrR family transcriptional regulator [Actinomycetota bacterium]
MTGNERREQLITIARRLFAAKGFESVSVEEIAAKADVSKPVVYEHFGGKEGLYAVIVDREMNDLLLTISEALNPTVDTPMNARILLERAAMALFDYIEADPDGFRILVRDAPTMRESDQHSIAVQHSPSFASVISDIAAHVQDLLAAQFKAHKINTKLAPMYSQMLVGMVALTGQWWLDERKPKKDEVVANVINLAWNGLGNMDPKPKLISKSR